MSVRELFDFVVEPSLAENQVDEYLEKVWPLDLVTAWYPLRDQSHLHLASDTVPSFCQILVSNLLMDNILHPSALGKHYSYAGFVLWLIAYQVQERIMNRAVEPSVEEQVAEAVFIQVCTILFAIGFFICCSCILHLQQWLGVVLIDGQETICKLWIHATIWLCCISCNKIAVGKPGLTHQILSWVWSIIPLGQRMYWDDQCPRVPVLQPNGTHLLESISMA